MHEESTNNGDGFSKYFEILPAISDNEKAAAFRIRHSVYCEDLAWEATRSDGMETDDYDAQSLHCLIRSRTSGDFIGCVRLILTAPDDPHALLPFERTCGPALHRSLLDPAKLPRERIAEVSRLAIVGQYRRRRGEKHTPAGAVQDSEPGSAEQPRFAWLLIGLYMGVFAIAARHGLEQLFLLSEPRLARHLNKIGITNVQIGKPTEHRGFRAPAVMDVQQVITNLEPLLKSVFVHVNAQLDKHYRAAD
jgi:N-acyl amino acid synthase of PEP-CTERM/exosortase system